MTTHADRSRKTVKARRLRFPAIGQVEWETLDIYSQIHRRGVRLIGAHETFQERDPTVAVRWTKPANLDMLASLFLDGRLRSNGLIDHTITPDEAPSIYEKLLQNPQRYLGIVINWC